MGRIVTSERCRACSATRSSFGLSPVPSGFTLRTSDRNANRFCAVEYPALDVVDVVAWIVGHHNHGRAIPAIHQQTALLIRGVVHGAANGVEPLFSQECLSGAQKLARGLLVLQHLEQPKEADLVVPVVIVVVVHDGGDGAHHLAVTLRREVAHLACWWKGVAQDLRTPRAEISGGTQ